MDVALYPLQSEALIQEAKVVSREGQFWGAREPEYVRSVVCGYYYHVFVSGEVTSIVCRLSSVAELERATVDPEQDSPSLAIAGWCSRCIYI